MAGVVHVPWYATGLRGDKLAAALADISAVALRYGARSHAIYRYNDDRYKFLQTAEFESKHDFEAYWYGPEFSDFRAMCSSWYTVPVLYGNRITLLFGRQDSIGRARPGRRRSDATIAVHPFAEDRDAVYRYSGGDTVVTLNPDGRTIPLVRVHVEPHGEGLTRRTAAFRGDIELDERRAQIVRMRGSFVTVGPRPRVRSRLLASQVEAIGYVELENAEFEQRFWLPAYQRIEAQARFSLLGDQRAVFRVVSRFRSLVVNPADSTHAAGSGVLTGKSRSCA